MAEAHGVRGFPHSPEAEAQRHACRVELQLRESMRITSLGFCLRFIVNEKPLNLEKTTSRVISVLLLIYVYIIYRVSVISFYCFRGERLRSHILRVAGLPTKNNTLIST